MEKNYLPSRGVQLSQTDVIEAFKTINFGNPDGLYDVHLKSYFLDNDYWEKIIVSEKFFVVGRKGTGKSAIYNWIKNHNPYIGNFIQNLSFSEFPFERFLSLSDNDFARPNQYQSIWKNIILIEFASLILRDESNPLFDELIEIKKYLSFCYGDNLTDLHRIATSKISKTEFGLTQLGLKTSSESSSQTNQESSQLTYLNRRLEELIINYRKKFCENPYFIQFDQLDDNYNYFADKKKYLESIISLCKIVYKLNQFFKMEGVEFKIIIYLRSDIYNQISSLDPESSRWANYKYELEWGITSDQRATPKLKKLINKRINKTLQLLNEEEAFDKLFDHDFLRIFEDGRRKSIFWHIVNRTFDRPRDIIQFCLFLQDEVKRRKTLDWTVFRDAEKKYSHWLIDEISNEIGPDIKNIEVLFKLLRTIGSSPFSFKHFSSAFIHGKFFSISMDPEDLINYLYKHGIVNNVNFKASTPQFFSSIRNERSQYDRNLLAILNKGILSGLDIYQ